MEEQLRVLIIEDNPSDALLLLRELRQEGYTVEHARVDNADDMVTALESTTWDIILSDFSMPSFSATAALKLMQDRTEDIPFIIVSGTMGEETAVEAMRAGAHDYFPKGRTARLGAAIRREIREAQEREQRKRAEAELRRTEAALQRNVQLIQLLQTVTVAANEANEIDDALQFAVEHISRFAGWSLGHVYLRAKGERPQLVSSHIWYSADPAAFASFQDASERIRLSEASDDLSYRVFDSGKPEQLMNLDSDTAGFIRSVEAHESGIRAAYAFPILAQHEVVAVMEFFSLTSVEPDQGLLDTIPHIATQIGHVIERVRSNEEIRALYDATAHLFNADTVHGLAQQIVESVVNEFEHVDCGLLWIDSPTGQIQRLARAGQYQVAVLTPMTLSGPGLVPKAIRENRIVYAPDVQHHADYMPNMPATRSEMVVPLRTRDRVIGVLDLQSAESDYFNQRDERILGAFAERAAAALEIIRLYEAINRHAAELELRVEARTVELQKAKERVEAILNNSSDAIILVDMEGTIQQTNPHFMETFGYDYDELFGQSLSQIVKIDGAEDLSHILSEIVSNREYRRLEMLVRRKDGSTFPADAAFAAFAHNHETEIVCSLRDISKQKQLEQELRLAFEQQKELADLKTRFISTVSHEYRTPLTIIMMSSSMMKMYSERLTNEEKLEHLDTIQTQVERLTALLDDVLEISRAESMKVEIVLETLSIADLCREIVTDFQQISPSHQIQLHLVGEVAPITADVKLMRQIISNLVSNAVKYSPNHGTVDVRLTFEDRQVVLVVSDEGMGIPEDDLDRLFTTFHRARNVGEIQGTGLGLAIVKQAIDAHGGTIAVNSSIGKGTIFTVTLPR